MTSIEIFGMDDSSDYEMVHKILFRHLTKKELGEIVFTIHEALVTRASGWPDCYIRVSDDNEFQAEKIGELLSNITNVEILILHKFLPKRRTKKTEPIQEELAPFLFIVFFTISIF